MKRKFAKVIVPAVAAMMSASFTAMTAFAEEAAEAAEATPSAGSNVFITLVVPLVIMFALLYFMAIRPQKKQEQALKEMQNSLEVGDEIVTRDGIIGMIVRVGDDNVVIETGGDRNKIRIKNWAIAENVSAAERAKAASPKKSDSALAAAGLSSDSDDKKSKKKKKDNDEE